MSKFNFSFRRSEKKAFKNISHGLIPAATIAPKPAVPRTPPPRSPYPSPERPRSALAAAILSSSLTGRTVAMPPPRHRSYSESDCSRSDSHTEFEPYASTALYTRDKWPESMAGRPRLPSPSHSDEEDECEEEEEDVEKEVLSDDCHVYQSLERQAMSPTEDALYALPLKRGATQSEVDDETEDSAFDIVSPLQTEEEIEVQEGALKKQTSLPRRPKSPSQRTMSSPDLTDDNSAQTPKAARSTSKKTTASLRKSSVSGRGGRSEASEANREALEVQKELVRELSVQTQGLVAEKQALERRCGEQGCQLQRSQERLQHLEQEFGKAYRERSPPAGEKAELLSLRQQAQELVDENDGLKMTVHRLNVELSRYQTRFRPLSKEESVRINGLPMKGPPPPWLLDMKYLSPLLLAYEDRLSEKDSLLQSCEEELKKFRVRAEEVVRENGNLHEQLGKTGGISQKEWRQLQDQARLVLQENQVLIEQLEVQHAKAKDGHSRHLTEVSKVSKQLMLLEAESQALQAELQQTRRELHSLQAQHQQARSSLEGAISWDQHCAIAGKLKRQLEEEEKRKRSEVEELLGQVSSLQMERKTLVLEKTNLSADIKSMEAELDLSRHAYRKAQRKIGLLKQQVEDSIEKELTAHQYLASIVALAEKTTQERDQLIYMASTLEKDKQGVLTRIVEGTVRLGKLQEKVKVYKKQAAASLGVMGHRLQEQEQDFAGKAASYQREIQHLQRLLRDKQEALDGVLQQKREVDSELEVVWEAATRENQRIREALLESRAEEESLSPAIVPQGFSDGPSPSWLPRQQEDLSPQIHPASSAPPPFTSHQSSALPGLQRSPMFEYDSDQHQNQSSDESEKNGMDFYS